MIIEERVLTGDGQGTMLIPARRTGTGVVVLTGSSGRLDVPRARLFAAQGAIALALRWFGGEGQVQGFAKSPVKPFSPRRTGSHARGATESSSSEHPGAPRPRC